MRFEAAWKVLTSRKVIVVTPGYQYSTYEDATCIQTDDYVRIEAGKLQR